MGGSDTTQSTQSQNVQQLPPWINQAAQQNYAYAQNVANRPLQQYQGQMVADVGPQMQQGWNLAANSGNVGQDQYNASQAGYMGVLGQQPQQVNASQLANTNLSPYMNPYTQSVINNTLPIMQQQLGLQQGAGAAAAAGANAFGGSRQGVQAGVTQAQVWRPGSIEREVLYTAVARHLAAHCPTPRSSSQPVAVALRLHHGEEIYSD